MQSLLENFRDRALDVMSSGAPVEPWMSEFAVFLQSQLPGSVVGISVLDRPGRTFRHSIFPTLPRAFGLSLENNVIISNRGTCGRAILSGLPIEVPDIALEERFSPQWRALLIEHGLTSILSTPALGLDGTPQGCVAVLHPVATVLDADQRALIQRASVLCAKVCLYSRTRETHQLLIGELEHRMRNLFAVIGGVADLTLKNHPTPKLFREAFSKRLVMMQRAHSIATSTEETSLHALLQEVLAPYAKDSDVQYSGPALLLSPEAAAALALVTNELATNAAKYGALSVPGGAVSIDWSIDHKDDSTDPYFSLTWIESNGPRVEQPGRKGYGTTMINGSLRNAFDGSATLIYDPQGFQCQVRAPFTGRLGKEVSLSSAVGVPTHAL